MISIGDIYDKDINFLFGSGASYGLLPTLRLGIKRETGGDSCTLEELATQFEKEKDSRLIPLFMHYYASCIRPAEVLSIAAAAATEDGRQVIENYRVFLSTVLAMLQRRKPLDRRCNIFTTNYDGCFPLAADEILQRGYIDFVLNDGTRGFSKRILQARNFSTFLCETGVFGRHQSSIPQINLIHLHGSVYWSKSDGGIQVEYNATEHLPLLSSADLLRLQPFSETLESAEAVLDGLEDPGFTPEELMAFWTRYEQIPIVNPTKWKFHETVYEEHYYQMLRLLSYELEKPNAVLITFGFSFADEHILNLVMRSLSNPGLQVFVCCFNQADQGVLSEKFKGYRNVRCLALEEGFLDFTAFNKTVLAWPSTTRAVELGAAQEATVDAITPDASAPAENMA
ncbi:TPA: SIR2 family protein [Pseudomonas aeruginosa]|uniref:SIR2 family protein n=1 Tax=Pseudomonas TaxID=286 RepID=UPI0003C7C86B|nr:MULTISPECIES: SIR2 family protein [Pseudomonas]EKX2958450.1 SIR2 family protein [Pseudomonas aeruginosa]MBG4113875.1 SIR2 family protein [Pseudomonas aeruginosa]MBI6936996.1 SIR2 family protein [Pseudomonas aeruginosa]MBI8014217.1 SIR2 family protein [Pseudomonas aeruginosa]MBV6241967.1 SIR2 family protein [Pseudomonas aeruginosa]